MIRLNNEKWISTALGLFLHPISALVLNKGSTLLETDVSQHALLSVVIHNDPLSKAQLIKIA